jgi:hypothetical protein
MRCNICNRVLESYEVARDIDGRWKPCHECYTIAHDAAVDEGDGHELPEEA